MRRILVDYSVAVVVQTVEMFVSARINFRIVVVAVARLFGSENAERFAETLGIVADSEAVVVRIPVERTAACNVFAFVDFAVAVVVQIVADFTRFGMDFRVRIVAVAAFEYAEIAFGNAEALVFVGSEAVVVQVFVVSVAVFCIRRIDDFIAVVVDSVADFFRFRIDITVRIVAVAPFFCVACRRAVRTVVVENDFFAAETVAVAVKIDNAVGENQRNWQKNEKKN